MLIAGDSRIYSGSDAGGRAASVQSAAENGDCDHDLGYWASEWDPTGRVHPLVNSRAVEDRFVQPTTLPYVCAAAPLASSFGLAGALAVSIVGVLLAAVGAWMIDRSAGGSGVLAFVLVGVTGPVAFYGTDTWEHAPAVGASMLGTAYILTRSSWSTGALGGLLWGLAVSMRTETAIVAVALGFAVLVVPETRRMIVERRFRVLLAASIGGAVLVLDRWFQQTLIGSDVRSERASTQVGRAFGGMADRVRDAVVTTIGLFPTDVDRRALAIGAIFVAVIFLLGVSLGSDAIRPALTRSFAVVVLAILAFRIRDPSFVPGLFASAPIAILGLLAVGRGRPPLLRAISLGAVVALPAIWAVQWTGNLAPQWGGRYSLLSGALLAVCGTAVVRPHLSTFVGRTVVLVTVAIGVLGLVWHVERTVLFGRVADEVLDVDCDDVLISASPYLLREAGSYPDVRRGIRSDGCRLLSAQAGELDFALEVAARSGARRPRVLLRGLSPSLPPALEDRRVVSTREIEIDEVDITVVTIELAAPRR